MLGFPYAKTHVFPMYFRTVKEYRPQRPPATAAYCLLACLHTHRRLGGVSSPLGRPPPINGKLFRVVRACARFGCLVRSRADSGYATFPFSLMALGGVHFYLLAPGSVPFSLVRQCDKV